jgi:hypothetical protein
LTKTYLGGEELVKDGEDGFEGHASVADRVSDPTRLRFLLVIQGESLEEGDDVGYGNVRVESLRDRRV